MNDTQIKDYIKKLKEFYTQVFVHLIGNVCALLIWMLFSTKGYWPLWVHLTSAAILIIEGYRKNIIKWQCDCDWIPFLRKDWEEETFQQMKMEQGDSVKEKPQEKTPTTKEKPKDNKAIKVNKTTKTVKKNTKITSTTNKSEKTEK